MHFLKLTEEREPGWIWPAGCRLPTLDLDYKVQISLCVCVCVSVFNSF